MNCPNRRYFFTSSAPPFYIIIPIYYLIIDQYIHNTIITNSYNVLSVLCLCLLYHSIINGINFFNNSVNCLSLSAAFLGEIIWAT